MNSRRSAHSAYQMSTFMHIVSREEAEKRRAGFPTGREDQNAGRNARAPLSLFFDDLLYAKADQKGWDQKGSG